MSEFSRDVGLLGSLERTLLKRGYRTEQPWSPGPISSGRMSLVGRVAHVRVTADRGQWFIEVRPATGGAKWFDLEQWSACLGHGVSFHSAERGLETAAVAEALAASWQLQPQLSWLERHLAEVEEACASHEASTVLECLSQRGGRN